MSLKIRLSKAIKTTLLPLKKTALSLILAFWFGSLFSITSAFAQTLCATATGSPPTPPTYYYDAGGRLSSILNASGASSNYNYDQAGNTLSIVQIPSTTVQVLQVCPNAAPVGSAVTIWGTGFSSTLAVKFGATAATNVAVISANAITAVVPSRATSGVVTVTPSGGSGVSSPSAFNVGAVAPQVTGVSGGTTIGSVLVVNPFPYYGAASGTDATSSGIGTGTITGAAAGTQSLTISGTGFDTTTPLTSTKNKVWIGQQAAGITAASATSLTVNVPVGGSVLQGGTPAEITVETPNGTAAFSSQTLLDTPAAVNPSIISRKSTGGNVSGCGIDSSVIDAVNTTVQVGAAGSAQPQSVPFSSTASTSCPNSSTGILHFVAFVFLGNAKTMLNAQVSIGSPGYSSGAVLLVAPDGSEVDGVDLGGAYPPTPAANTSTFYNLPQTGTYTLYVQRNTPSGAPTATVTLNQVPASLALGSVALGSPKSAMVAAYQSISFTFTAPAGTGGLPGRVTLTSTLTNAAGSPFVVTITGPDGFTQVYNSGRPHEGDQTGFVSPGLIDFSGPVVVPISSTGATYTVAYQSLSPTPTPVSFVVNSLPADVLASGGCATWPTNSTTATCSGTISSPGQALYATVAATTAFQGGASATLVGALQTNATNFTGCFEVLVTDTGLNQQFYRRAQCGGTDFSYGLNFPRATTGPYLIQAFGFGQNTGSLQFTLSGGPVLPTVAHTSATFASAGQSQSLVYHPPAPAGSGSNFGVGNWISLSSSGPNGWTQCYNVSVTAQGSDAAFAAYLQCPSPQASGSLGVLQFPYASTAGGSQSNNYYINITPSGGQLGQVTFTAAVAAPPASGTIPINGSVYGTSLTSQSTYTFTPGFGAGSFANVLSLPNISASVSPCFDTQVQQGGTVLFDTANQPFGFELKNVDCGGVNMSAYPAAAALGSTAAGSVIFTPSSALKSPSGNFGLTLYNYTNVVSPATLTPTANGPSGVTLPSTLPGQPVSVNFATGSTTNFIKVIVGLDSNFAGGDAYMTVRDTSTNNQIASSQVSIFNTFAISIPNPGDTYQITVYPQDDSVGLVTMGVGLQ